jgi:hypothetical protein
MADFNFRASLNDQVIFKSEKSENHVPSKESLQGGDLYDLINLSLKQNETNK